MPELEIETARHYVDFIRKLQPVKLLVMITIIQISCLFDL